MTAGNGPPRFPNVKLVFDGDVCTLRSLLLQLNATIESTVVYVACCPSVFDQLDGKIRSMDEIVEQVREEKEGGGHNLGE